MIKLVKINSIGKGNIICDRRGTLGKIVSIDQENTNILLENGKETSIKTNTLIKLFFKSTKETMEIAEQIFQERLEESKQNQTLKTISLEEAKKRHKEEIKDIMKETVVETSNEVIYGVEVKKSVNQTTIWKILCRVCELRDEDGKTIVNELKSKYDTVFDNAKRCLGAKKKIAYVESLLEC